MRIAHKLVTTQSDLTWLSLCNWSRVTVLRIMSESSQVLFSGLCHWLSYTVPSLPLHHDVEELVKFNKYESINVSGNLNGPYMGKSTSGWLETESSPVHVLFFPKSAIEVVCLQAFKNLCLSAGLLPHCSKPLH